MSLLTVYRSEDASFTLLTDSDAGWDFEQAGDVLRVFPARQGALEPIAWCVCRARTLSGLRRRCARFVLEFGPL